jgi:fructose transport system ATP-binding protein
MTAKPILEARKLEKSYGNVIALNGSSLELYPGEVLALVGDNGAGKSTLIKCLSGAEVPDTGGIYLEGEQVTFHKPQDGRAAGVETVYQSLAVAPALDIAANLYLGREIRKRGPLGAIFRLLDSGAMKNASKEHISNLGISTIQNISQAVGKLFREDNVRLSQLRAQQLSVQKLLFLMSQPRHSECGKSNQVLKLIEKITRSRSSGNLKSTHMPQVFESGRSNSSSTSWKTSWSGGNSKNS